MTAARFRQSLALALLGAGLTSTAVAMTIDVAKNDFGPFGQATVVRLAGDIVPGDAAQLASALAEVPHGSNTSIHVVLASPGGSLLEGMEIGRVLARQDTTVTTDVGQDVENPGDCASACVLAYMGGRYRFLQEGSSLGIHQFYLDGNAEIGGHDGVAIGQVLSAEIVDYLTEMRVDSGFFRLMTQSRPEAISWVPREVLKDNRVVTGPILEEGADYGNANGHFFLTLWQQSYWGENKVSLTCNEAGDVVFIAFVEPPNIETFGMVTNRFGVLIDGSLEPAAQWDFAGARDRWGMTVFTLAPEQVERLEMARSFGVRMMPEEGDFFLGFEAEIRDGKVRDMVRGCR